MRRIEKFEEARKANKSLKELNINRTLYRAYMGTVEETGNQLIDFSDIVWEDDVEEILQQLKEIGEREFTISSSFSNLIRLLEKFTEQGCRMDGLTKVKARYYKPGTGEKAMVPAIKMTIL